MERLRTHHLLHPHQQQDCPAHERTAQIYVGDKVRDARYWQYVLLWMVVERWSHDLPWCSNRRSHPGTKFRQTDEDVGQNSLRPAKDGADHLLSRSLGHADEQYRHDARHRHRSRGHDRLCLSLLCSAHWLYRHLRHGFRHFGQHSVRQTAGCRRRTTRFGSQRQLLRRQR